MKEIQLGQCSYYPMPRSKKNQPMTISQFVNSIRSHRWKAKVESYRQLKAEGDLEHAEAIKQEMPCIIIAGVCEGGHSKQNFRSFSGFMMLDIDHYPGDIRALLNQLKEEPWTYAGWISISGDGAKVVVRIDAVSQAEYETLAYPMVARHVSRLFDFPVDMHCQDLTRTCYASHDADAFLKEACEVFPWREEVAEFMAEQAQEEVLEKPVELGSTPSQGLVRKFLDEFIERHPYVRNHRHDFQLALGREARRAGMNESEFEELVSLAVSELAMPDCDGPEIRRNLADAYRFAELNHLEKYPRLGQMGPKGPRAPYVRAAEEGDLLEETIARNREMRLAAPLIPDWVFENLPCLLADGLTIAKDTRQRDMLFLSMVVNLSGCMPRVKMVYDDTDIYPHLFLAVIASSASGKGVMAHAARLGYPIQAMLDKENEQKLRQYEENQLVWEQERQRALKEKRKPDMKLRPEPVRKKTLMIPADVSRTKLIQDMSTSPDGVIINVSEMDTLRTALGAEYGRFDDLMRACFHHEMFGSDFKTDKQQYMVYCPKLAFCASGTPSQFYKLCPSAENGAYSRYLIYMAEQEAEFRLMSPSGIKRTRNEVFLNLGGKTLEMYRFLQEYPTEVKFTSDQWNWHLSYYSDVLQQVRVEESEGPVSVVLRHGLNTARLAMIFTALRKYEGQWSFHEMTCSDEDFRKAMGVMEVLLQHSLMLSTTLRKETGSPVEMRHYFRVLQALETLPTEFRYTDLMDALHSVGISLSTSKRIRARLLDIQIIEKEGDVYRFKSRKWRVHLKNRSGELGSR
ncbi:MAG: DUF3987 domain-containing protein [Bacteroides sp.]|nr:DUF3987 domain-containing protein [Bacteroides sp.]